MGVEKKMFVKNALSWVFPFAIFDNQALYQACYFSVFIH